MKTNDKPKNLPRDTEHDAETRGNDGANRNVSLRTGIKAGKGKMYLQEGHY